MRPGPIFILGPHKSGTSLLRSLFDGVENYFVLPIETHCFQLLNTWIRYPYRRQFPKENDVNLFIESAIDWIRKSNRNKDKYADAMTVDWFDEKVFSQTLTHKLKGPTHQRDFIDAYFASIYKSLNGKEIGKDTGFIEKSVENAEFAIDLFNMYPNANFVHIVRNPYSNLCSLRRYKGINKYPYLITLCKALFNSYYFLYRNEKIIPNYKIIKYEDLVTDAEGVMKNICSSFNLAFNERMVLPTSRGELWEGNSTSGKKFIEVSNDRLNKWEADIYDLEIGIVNKLFPYILDRFGYERLEDGLGSYFKCKNEDFKGYIVNRLFLRRAVSMV